MGEYHSFDLYLYLYAFRIAAFDFADFDLVPLYSVELAAFSFAVFLLTQEMGKNDLLKVNYQYKSNELSGEACLTIISHIHQKLVLVIICHKGRG